MSILPREIEMKWLDDSMMIDELKEIMVPLEDGLLDAHTISKLVTNRMQDRNVPEVLDGYKYPGLPDL